MTPENASTRRATGSSAAQQSGDLHSEDNSGVGRSLWNMAVESALGADLSLAAMRLYLALMRNLIGYGGRVSDQFGRDLLMREAGLRDTRTFERARDELVASGLLVYRSGGRGRGKRSYYELSLTATPDNAAPGRPFENDAPERHFSPENAAENAAQNAALERQRIEHDGPPSGVAATAPASDEADVERVQACDVEYLGEREREPEAFTALLTGIDLRYPGRAEVLHAFEREPGRVRECVRAWWRIPSAGPGLLVTMVRDGVFPRRGGLSAHDIAEMAMEAEAREAAAESSPPTPTAAPATPAIAPKPPPLDTVEPCVKCDARTLTRELVNGFCVDCATASVAA